MRRVKAQAELPEEIFAEPEHIEAEKKPEKVDEEKVEREERESIFPSEYMEPLRGLMFLGAIEKEIEYGGHIFLIRTLREGEIIRIGQLLKDYKGAATEFEARKMYTVAACIESVDGIPLRIGIKDGYDIIYDKAKEVRQWYPAVIKFIYDRYIELEVAAIEISNSLKK